MVLGGRRRGEAAGHQQRGSPAQRARSGSNGDLQQGGRSWPALHPVTPGHSRGRFNSHPIRRGSKLAAEVSHERQRPPPRRHRPQDSKADRKPQGHARATPSGARLLRCRARRRVPRRVSCSTASRRRPTRPRSRAGACCRTIASNSPCGGSRAPIDGGLFCGRLCALEGHGHFTIGGSDDKIKSTLPPVRSPKIVPRSYSRLNST